MKKIFTGNTEKNLLAAFDFSLEHLPAILFFDEIDTIQTTKNDGEVVNDGLMASFLSALDEVIKRKNLQLLVMAATNFPQNIQKSLLRRYK